MYLLLLGVIAVGAGLLLVYYSMKDKKDKKAKEENWDPKDKGKVIYLFDDEDDDGSGFVDPKPDKLKAEKTKTESKEEKTASESADKNEENGKDEPTKKDD